VARHVVALSGLVSVIETYRTAKGTHKEWRQPLGEKKGSEGQKREEADAITCCHSPSCADVVAEMEGKGSEAGSSEEEQRDEEDSAVGQLGLP
jgi:hypothetical protein